jgi:hypothetical protein
MQCCTNTVLYKYSAVQIQCCTNTVLYKYSVVQIQCCTNSVLYKYSAVKIQCCTNTVLYKYSAVQIQCCTNSVLYKYSAVQIQYCTSCPVERFNISQNVMSWNHLPLPYVYATDTIEPVWLRAAGLPAVKYHLSWCTVPAVQTRILPSGSKQLQLTTETAK